MSLGQGNTQSSAFNYFSSLWFHKFLFAYFFIPMTNESVALATITINNLSKYFNTLNHFCPEKKDDLNPASFSRRLTSFSAVDVISFQRTFIRCFRKERIFLSLFSFAIKAHTRILIEIVQSLVQSILIMIQKWVSLYHVKIVI